MLKLYGNSLSPYARKVMLVQERKRIPYENDPLSPVLNPSEEFLRISPLREIPVLRDGEFGLPDSSLFKRASNTKE
ncbi:MAG TPA: glutathione S-transferase N-terminal domain-containing protein [Myxococcota bacterium]|nr:glutathione S-transferase N-terminal domain-containing protein [Myxococcota bacterium]